MRIRCGVFLIVLAIATSALAADHPLDPLSAEEIARAAEIVRSHRQFPRGALFPVVALREPAKAEVLAWQAGTPFRREAQVVVLDRAANRTYEAVADLNAGKVSAFVPKPGTGSL